MSSKEIECKNTDEIVCPYCGFEFSDSWEYDQDTEEIDCLECDKTFNMTRNVYIDYSTSKLEK